MNPIKKAILVGIMTVVVYLTVVVLTTPALERRKKIMGTQDDSS